MKAVENWIQKTKPNFEKGGKYEKWLPIYESFETFLHVPGNVTLKGSHVRDAIDLKRALILVIFALVPTLLYGMYNVGSLYYTSIGENFTMWEALGYGFLKVLPLIIVSYVVGLGIEFMFCYIRGHEISEGYLVSGLIIPMIVPVDIPLWELAIAVAFAVIIGKEAFGGTGMNIVNPALLARAFLFFAYPGNMSGSSVWVHTSDVATVDGFSGETILGQLNAGVAPEAIHGVGMNQLSVCDLFVGNYAGCVGETSVIAILIGAVILLFTGIASYRIMLSVFAGGFLMGLVMNAIAPEGNMVMNFPAFQQLLIGGFAFGAVFMATDPVTAAQTNIGKWIYGFLIGVFAIMIRCFNPAYPEGMMLAILLMNVFAPLIDHLVVQANIKKRLKRAKVTNA
ncbi:MAG: NADH:ubiquinone reductase (Na(+)-transporting) subunit B [Bacteroidales bacterium]|nr:NADH:ubiquinone reductase (Na(+)-transporting) subunit B [Bacteroidales bacterium]